MEDKITKGYYWDDVDDRLYKESLEGKREMKRVNLGCGKDIRIGWDNVDILKDSPIKWNLDKIPYGFAKDNIYDYILLNSVLSSLDNPTAVLMEIWRIGKNGAMIDIKVPYYNSKGAYQYFLTKRYFSDASFKIFCDSYKDKFEIEELKLPSTNVGKYIVPSKWLRKKLSLFFGGLIAGVHIKIKIIKEQKNECEKGK